MSSRRPRRKGEYVCTCHAYRFPHRFGGGRCGGVFLVEERFEPYTCGRCNLLNEGQCEVLDGQEDTCECPVWQEFVERNEIKIYLTARQVV